MKNYILLILIALCLFTSCKKKGVLEGDWNAKLIHPETGTVIPLKLNINESKVYWDVSIHFNDSTYHLDAKQVKDSLFWEYSLNNSKYSLKIIERNRITGKWTNGYSVMDFEADYIEEQ